MMYSFTAGEILITIAAFFFCGWMWGREDGR